MFNNHLRIFLFLFHVDLFILKIHFLHITLCKVLGIQDEWASEL